MFRVLAATAAGVTLLGAAYAQPKSGRVVRVERLPRHATTMPRSCEHIEGDVWICRGTKPVPGEIISVVAQDAIAAEVRIAEVKDVPTCHVAWRVRGRVLHGDVNVDPAAAVIDPTLDSRTTRLLPAGQVTRSPSGRADDDVDWAIDRNGDGREDLVATSYICDDTGKPDVNAGNQCFDLWTANGFEMRQAHPTILPRLYVVMRRRDLLAAERGTLHKEAETRVALVYPSPYRAAMSSLGYQQIYRVLHAMPNVAADRAMLPDAGDDERGLVTLETGQPVGGYPILAYSVAYELEIAGVVETLERAGIPPLAGDRDARHPLVIAGGPLTFSNPAPLAPFFDAILLGEGEELVVELVQAARDAGYDRDGVLARLAGRPGYYLPHRDGEIVPAVAAADDALLPARSQIATPHTELADMFMTEAARGCSRGCTYCVMRRSTNGGMRIVPRETIVAGIPADARRVGLVGAAVTDHPQIAAVVRDIVDAGREVGISSLRADKLTDELVGLLARGGYRTLTVAADGASERMRRVVERTTRAEHLVRSAELAAAHRLHTLKVYMMLGVPGETDADVDELVQLSAELARVHPRIAFGVAPFVAKRHTPLDGTPFAGIDVVEDRLDRLRRGLTAAHLAGKVSVRPTSARWAWVEYMLAQGETVGGLAVMDAHRAGGSFAAYRKAFTERGVVPTGPRARVPSSQELIALKRRALSA